MQFVKLAGRALISEEGEAPEGLALDGGELLSCDLASIHVEIIPRFYPNNTPHDNQT